MADPAPPPSDAPSGRDLWWVRLVIGILLAGLGVVLLFSPGVAAVTLAWLIGIALIAHGLDDLAFTTEPRWVGIVTGLVSITAGIAGMVWPSITLWVLAVIAGIAFLAVGLMRIAMGFMAKGVEGWTWVVAAGVASVLVGVMALAWPDVTALVLCILLGLRTLMIGVTQILIAWAAHRARLPLDVTAR